MGHRDALRDVTDAQSHLLDAALVLGAHLDAPAEEIDDKMLLRALCAFMEARACYLASLGARYGITLDTGPPSIHARHGVLELLRRFRPTA